MARKENIDRLLREWPYDPQGISVRKKKGDDGREVLQMRLDLGLLQLEVSGRPDGTQPEGQETFYAHLQKKAEAEGPTFQMSEEECEEADREFVQYYHRRVCWLALREFDKAVADADHTLNLMDFCKEFSPDDQWTLSHEQYRPFVLFHRTQAAALSALGDAGAEAAVEFLNEGLERIKKVFADYEAEEEYDEDELVNRLVELRESLRQHFGVGQTLQERLEEAVASEKYELAAEIRDQMAKRTNAR